MAESIKFGGTTVRLPHPVPAKFDHLAASDRELLLHGFPSRPDAKRFPALHEHWKRVLGRPFQYVVPTFKPHPEIQHARHRRVNVKDDIASYNWSGSVALLQSAADQFKWVSGSFSVPHAFPPTGAPDGATYHHSAWIGIDGFTTDATGLVQVGVHQQLTAKKGFPDSVNYYMWWDWVPGYEIEIAFYVMPGDTIHAIICATSPTEALVFLLNENSLQGTSFWLDGPQEGTLIGSSAEWIVEAPLVNNEIAQLTRFHEITFEETYASATNEGIFTAPGGTMITMYDTSGTTRLATAAADGDAVRVTSRD